MPSFPASARNATSFLANARLWHLVDAKYQTVGNLATNISQVLQGKHKPIYHRSANCGDHVVVINTKLLHFTSERRIDFKHYRYHTGYAGGLKIKKAKDYMELNPPLLLRRAVFGMLPRNPSRRALMNRLHVFQGEETPYSANIVTCNTPELFFERELIKGHEKLYWKWMDFDPSSVRVDARGKVHYVPTNGEENNEGDDSSNELGLKELKALLPN